MARAEKPHLNGRWAGPFADQNVFGCGGGVEVFGPLEGRFLARQRRQVRKGGPRSNDAFGAVEQLAEICPQLG